MSNDFDKFAILDSFLDEVASYLPEIEAHLDRLQQNTNDREAIEETYRRAHTIGGSAAMMDFTGLSQVSRGMEEILGDALDGNAPLDAPTIALLRRSYGRLSRVLELVRSGGDSAQIIAEDEADRAAWRGRSSANAASVRGAGVESSTGKVAVPGRPASGPAPQPNTSPNLPDWLVAFGEHGSSAAGGEAGVSANQHQMAAPTPAVDPWGASMPSWPTGQTPARNGGAHDAGWSSSPPIPRNAAGSEPTFQEMIGAFRTSSTDIPASPGMSQPGAGMPPGGQPQGPSASRGGQPSDDVAILRTGPVPSVGGANAGRQATPEETARTLAAISPAWEDIHITEDAVRRQVSALRDVVATLREAAQAMEDERTELRTFLDGSKDALNRLEEWAGQAMGLDLRQSPDHVRRYLPLSVIWVTTTRLKKLVTLLNNSGRRLTASQEDINEALAELHNSIQQAGQLFSSVAAVASSAGATGPDGGFQATLAQVTHFAWSPQAAPAVEAAPPAPAVSDAVTAPPAPVSPPTELPPGARAELERSVREDLRRELEDEVRAEVASEVRREEESRLRHELEIQVRRQMLSELTPGLGAVLTAGSMAAVHGAGPIVPPLASMADRASKPVQVTDQSPEALDVFREEADEHLQHITLGIRQLETNPKDREALQSVRRATHTLKGAAGMMGFQAIQELAHASEDLLDRLMDGAMSLTPQMQGLLLDTSEALEQMVAASGAPTDTHASDDLRRRYDALLGRKAGASATSSAPATQARPAAPQVPAEESEGEAAADLFVRLRLSKLDELINLFGDLLQNRSILDERVTRLARMIADTTLASQRLRDVGSQLETRFEAATLPSGRRTGPLTRSDLSRPALGGIQGPSGPDWAHANGSGAAGRGGPGANNGPSHLNEFDELELDRYTEFHRLSRGLSESVADMATLSSEMETIVREVEAIFARETRLSSAFQDRLMKARLVPLQGLVPRLYRAVRAAAIKQGKDTEFFVEGADTEIDRTVYEEVADPLLHLVRNAVAHGIERPDMRARGGKARAGHIYLSAAEEGNQVVITVRDDGAGVDPEKVRKAAVARGLIDAHQRLSQRTAQDLLFQPGLSTADSIDQESGRGVGLDVVKDAVARMRGTVEVESTPGQGTTFTLRIPVSLQITRVVLAKVGPQLYAIPMSVVEQIGRLDYYERARGDGPPAVEVRGNVYPLVHLASYLNVQPGQVDEKSPVLLCSAGRQHMALILDAIPGRQEVVVKSLGPHLRDVRGVSGATVLGDGRVVLILNLPELLAIPPRPDAVVPVIPASTGSLPRLPASASRTTGGPAIDPAAIAQLATNGPAVAPSPRGFVIARAEPAESRSTPGRPLAKPITGETAAANRVTTGPIARPGYVLVVDDSPSVRRVVSGMLKANGWEVQTARDGLEALEIVGRQTPTAVLLDIEMPRMDGYELMASVRSQPQYRHLPLIVLTSRAAAKHQQRAIQLGADAYVVKPYQDEELLKTLDSLVAGGRVS
ncbi:MAG TPA: Hpt domain-containing protein [Ktedonobacterales bacterium]